MAASAHSADLPTPPHPTRGPGDVKGPILPQSWVRTVEISGGVGAGALPLLETMSPTTPNSAQCDAPNPGRVWGVRYGH